jgi:hypothetical protein
MSDDQNPAEMEPTSARMLHQLKGMVRGYARDIHRVRNLVTFAERVRLDGGDENIRKMSDVRWEDRPEIEIYLKHRDDVLHIERALELQDLIIIEARKNEDPNKLLQAFNCISRLEQTKERHLQKMTAILETMSREFGAREAIMAKLASEGAKLAMIGQMHQEKMLLMRRKIGEEPGDDELERIANG